MSSKERRVIFEPFPKQEEYQRALLSGRYSYLLYGGAIKGGKTILTLSMLLVLCRIFPGSRWAIVREDLQRIKRNVLPVYNKIRPAGFMIDFNKSDMIDRAVNGSEILFFPESIKTDPDLDRFKGLDVNGFLLEEANELQLATFYKAIERAGSWIIPGVARQPPPFILLTCNPADNWVKQLFYTPWKAGQLKAPYYFLPASIFDNPYLPQTYIDSLKSLPEKYYRRFVEGDWSVSEEPDQLISYDWVYDATQREPVTGKNRMGIDVARFGDDLSVISLLAGYHLKDVKTYDKLDTRRVSEIATAVARAEAVDADLIGVDTVGLGAGVADNMRDDGFDVIEVIAGASPVEIEAYEAYDFKDLRSQMWWNAREMLREGRVSIGELDPEILGRLIEDLTAPRYSISAEKKIAVESKDKIRKRIGRSTDYADAFVSALFVEHLSAGIPTIRYA